MKLKVAQPMKKFIAFLKTDGSLLRLKRRRCVPPSTVCTDWLLSRLKTG
jgi:hypothetical protein